MFSAPAFMVEFLLDAGFGLESATTDDVTSIRDAGPVWIKEILIGGRLRKGVDTCEDYCQYDPRYEWLPHVN